MKKVVAAAFVAWACAARCAEADLLFADFFAFEPITRFDFGYRETVPAIEIAYVRSEVGDSYTEVTVVLDDPNFRILGHSCPSTLADGRSCMIFVSFDPELQAPARGPRSAFFRGQLAVTSNEGYASLEIAGHRDGDYCRRNGLPLTTRCTTPPR